MSQEFEDSINSFSRDLVTLNNDVFLGVGEECLRSVVEGSDITGAPGQPVGQYGKGYNEGAVGGFLKASWQRWFPSPTEQTIATDAPYAQPIEDLVGRFGPIRIRSTVGGGHSVKLTIAGFDKIVDAVVRRVAGR